MMFKNPRTIFQQDLNDIMKERDETALIEDLIGLQMLKDSERDERLLVLRELFDYLGIEKFMGVMNILAGKTVKFPQKDSFKETIQIALCWYYKKVKNYDWDTIKALLKDDELSSVKFGIKIQNLQKFMLHYESIKNQREAIKNGRID